MRRELEARAAAAVELATSAGANDAWAIAEYEREIEAEVRDARVEKLQESTSRSLSLRLYVDGRYGTFRTSDLRSESLSQFTRQSIAMTRALARDPFRRIPEPALFANRPTDDLDLVDASARALEARPLIDLCMDMHESARQHERLISATTTAGGWHGLSAAASSNGFAGAHERSQLYRMGNATLRDAGDARASSSYFVSARHARELPSATDVGAATLREAVRRLGATQGPTRRTMLVVEPRMGARLIGALLDPANAAAFSQERSFWRTRVGERTVSERLELNDDPLVPRGLGSRSFDGEGISARRRSVVRGGALQTIYADTYYARKIEREPTTGERSNLLVTPGTRALDAIVRDVRQGLLVTNWLGGNSDTTTGDFSFGVRGQLLENGRVGASVQEMNVTGNLLGLFASLVEVGNDPWMFASMRTPTLVFENVQISGA